MFNIKKILCYSILILSAQRCPNSYAIGERMADVFGKAYVAGNTVIGDKGIAATTIFVAGNQKVIETAVAGGSEMASILAEGGSKVGVDAAGVLAASNQKIAEMGTEAAGRFAAIGEGAVVVAGGAVCILAAVQVWSMGKDIKSYAFPSKEQQARTLEAEEKYEILKTRKDFKKCLVNKAKLERGSSGRPLACEEAARMLAMAAGDYEVDSITKVFNNHYSK